MSDFATVTLAELLEAAGWVRRNVCVTPVYDLWIDPLDKHGRAWFGSAAVIEELRRRGPPLVAQDGTALPPHGITFDGNPDEGRFHDGTQVRLAKEGKDVGAPLLFDEEDVPW